MENICLYCLFLVFREVEVPIIVSFLFLLAKSLKSLLYHISIQMHSHMYVLCFFFSYVMI